MCPWESYYSFLSTSTIKWLKEQASKEWPHNRTKVAASKPPPNPSMTPRSPTIHHTKPRNRSKSIRELTGQEWVIYLFLKLPTKLTQVRNTSPPEIVCRQNLGAKPNSTSDPASLANGNSSIYLMIKRSERECTQRIGFSCTDGLIYLGPPDKRR